jgi:DHA1 family florfenicol/chloramphenicol resistance protein-like MFS transporter
MTHDPSRRSILPLFRSLAFWTYTLGFSVAMGTFFVYFSTAPRVLIDRAGYSELEFSFAFASAAVVMIITARFAKLFVARWGTAGSLLRGMLMLLLGAVFCVSVGSLGNRFFQHSSRRCGLWRLVSSSREP